MSNISNASNKMRYFKIFLLILGSGVIYPVLYLRQNYQTSITLIFDMTVQDLNFLYLILGIMNIIGYVQSGLLADKFSARKLISLSLFLTGAFGLWFAQIPDKKFLVFIYIGWGISAVFTFWSALLKGIKLLAKKDEQARIFGFLDGGRGLIEALLGVVAVSMFAFILRDNMNDAALTKKALQSIIYMYSFLCIFIAILIFIFLKEDKDNNNVETNNDENNQPKVKRSMLEDIKILLSIKEYWLATAIIFCGYSIYWTVYYYSGFLTVNHGANAVMAGYISVAMLWMRPVGGIGGGMLGDKIGRTVTISIAMFFGVVLLLLMSLFKSFPISIYYVLVILTALIGYALRGLYWSTLDYCDIPEHILGRAIGIMSMLGYSVDIFIPYIGGRIFSHYNDGPMAYIVYFLMSAFIGIIGLIITIMLHFRLKKASKL
ncbi:MFS transporter [Brachyspira sp.]|uniref:MFS transporter n=1 Tax=Brachyspira sp. TaxID=1977261 RepID=UPI00263691DA|nr:MFS transporter [Brachyspira sp.]